MATDDRTRTPPATWSQVMDSPRLRRPPRTRLRHHSNDADVQLELARAAAVALMPPLALPAGDPALAVRDIAETTLRRRLVAVTRANPPAPALTALLDAVLSEARR